MGDGGNATGASRPQQGAGGGAGWDWSGDIFVDEGSARALEPPLAIAPRVAGEWCGEFR